MADTRTATGLKRLNAYLHKDFMRLVAEDVRLSALWHTLIASPLIGHTRPVSYIAGQLLVHADSPAWASRVRQQQQSLCQTLRRDPFFKDLVDISVRVAPPGSHDIFRPSTTRQPAARLSPHATEVLRSMVRTTRDPALQAAFERLLGSAGAPDHQGRKR